MKTRTGMALVIRASKELKKLRSDPACLAATSDGTYHRAARSSTASSRRLLEARGEPGTRGFPIALHRDHGYLEHRRNFFFGQASEEAQLHDPGGARICRCQRRQQGVQVDELF